MLWVGQNEDGNVVRHYLFDTEQKLEFVYQDKQYILRSLYIVKVLLTNKIKILIDWKMSQSRYMRVGLVYISF